MPHPQKARGTAPVVGIALEPAMGIALVRAEACLPLGTLHADPALHTLALVGSLETVIEAKAPTPVAERTLPPPPVSLEAVFSALPDPRSV